MLSYCKVSWEIFSYTLAGTSYLPPVLDVLLVAEYQHENVTEANELRRVSTGTNVMYFPGCES